MSALTFPQAFGLTGEGGGGLTYPLNFFTSGTWTAPFDCTVALRIHGSGGSGAAHAVALGGNSAPWGLKWLALSAGDVLTISIGAGGAPVTAPNDGLAGSTTTVQLNGVTILTAAGGEGGLGAASGALNPAAASAVVTGADVWFPGLQSGSASGSPQRLGGAAANLSCDGSGRSPSANTGGAYVGGSVGVVPTINATTAVDAPPLIAFATLGFFALAGMGKGGGIGLPGGLFGGGGGTAGSVSGGAGGIGAGGGASNTTSGNGGKGYVFMTVTKVA